MSGPRRLGLLQNTAQSLRPELLTQGAPPQEELETHAFAADTLRAMPAICDADALSPQDQYLHPALGFAPGPNSLFGHVQ